MEQRPEQNFRPVAVLSGMGNILTITAESLCEIEAGRGQPLTTMQRQALRKAADILTRLEKLRQDLLTTVMTDSDGEDNLTADLMSLLGLESGS